MKSIKFHPRLGTTWGSAQKWSCLWKTWASFENRL